LSALLNPALGGKEYSGHGDKAADELLDGVTVSNDAHCEIVRLLFVATRQQEQALAPRLSARVLNDFVVRLRPRVA